MSERFLDLPSSALAHGSLTRRRLLQAFCAAAASTSLNGCHRPAYFVLAAGTLAPLQAPPAAGDLTVDTHCHLFNGTDIQLKNFLEYTHQGFRQFLINIVQEAEEKVGPRGKAELVDLQFLAQLVNAPASSCIKRPDGEAPPPPLSPARTQSAAARKHIDNMRKRAFHNAQTGMRESRQNNPPSPSPTDQEVDGRLNEALTTKDHRALNSKAEKDKAKAEARYAATPHRPGDECGDPKSIPGELETAFDYFMPRIVLAQIYLDTFCPSAGRNVDLMFAAMVDYDWWLANGKSPLTPLQDQVKVMEQISILSGGRIHGFAPFCPLREVAHRAGYGPNPEEITWSSLDFVQDAVRNHGCVGVKLYPPMGFAPYGNADFDISTAPPWNEAELATCAKYPLTPPLPHSDFWARNKHLPEWITNQKPIRYASDGSEERLGVRLDQALDALYQWCQAEGVPILAHTNTTNGIDCAYQNLAMAQYWRPVLTRYPGLRVSFGHMGGFDDYLQKKVRQIQVPASTLGFMDLMDGASTATNGVEPAYLHAYGDSAYDAVLLGCKEEFTQRLTLAYNNPNFSRKFIFGSDWSLMVHVGRNDLYLKEYEILMKEFDSSHKGTGRKPSEAFFGWNAVEYTGLKQNDPARQRLNTFYDCHSMPKPVWAQKVDNGTTPPVPA